MVLSNKTHFLNACFSISHLPSSLHLKMWAAGKFKNLPPSLPPSLPENASLTLSVEVIDSPSSEYLTPLYPNDNHYHSVGNVTFISILNATFSPNEVYYSYDFGDGQSLIYSLKQNVTHEYSEKGNFTYNVSVVAIGANDTSYHAENSSYIILIGKSP